MTYSVQMFGKIVKHSAVIHPYTYILQSCTYRNNKIVLKPVISHYNGKLHAYFTHAFKWCFCRSLNTYTSKYEVSKSYGARNSFHQTPPGHPRAVVTKQGLPPPHPNHLAKSLQPAGVASSPRQLPAGYMQLPRGGVPVQSQPYHQPHNCKCICHYV